ncbi:MAG: cupredoxin domain-containing protein [Bacillota bacterium]
MTTQVGGRVKIHLINQGTREHTLTIPRWSVFTRNLAPGEENYVEFTANEKGTWPFFSDASGEPEPGLGGELRVE